MSGYRSLKRVLGESNLERKCRWLFGLCVGGLILLAFWWVDWIAEDLIERQAQQKGADLVRMRLMSIHDWVPPNDPLAKKFRAEMVESFSVEHFDAQLLKLDAVPEPWLAETIASPPQNEFERELLKELEQEVQQAANLARSRGSAAADAADVEPIFRDFPVPRDGRYYYYQVVHWSNKCVHCHYGMHQTYAQSVASTAGTLSEASSTPLRVMRVSFSDAQTQGAIHRTRAILLAVGILTVFLAMVALYYVVKYIVIKPLSHLREVSDEVARGDLGQRADIRTNDEFEDLAASFNKMLVHLVQAQGELREANDELDGKVDELARLNMQLHEMNRLKGEFLANMSHELRTPLNSIIGFSEVLQSLEALNDKQKRFAQNIQISGRKLLELINDILDLSKMEAGKMEVRLSEFHLKMVIANQCDLVREMAEEKNIDLQTEIEGDLPLLYQDQTKVQQILTNLLSNAIKFTPEGGRITVGARSQARGVVELWVADTGVGIPAAEQEIIFEKFRQGKAVLGRDNLTREYSGTGLGLSIVKELCKLLGGEVSVESELGRGSTFRVLIPWMRTDTPAAAARIAARLDDLAATPRPLSPAESAVAAAAPAGNT